MVEAYPLHWPTEYPATPEHKRKDSRFKTTLGAARDFVKDEVRRMGGKNPVISANIPLKNDGDLRADWNRYKIDNPGVAVYFTYNNNPVCLCCDQYKRVWENLYAVGRTIEALRQIDRDGVSDFLNRAFTGFKALPEGSSTEPTTKPCWDILGIAITSDKDAIQKAYRKKVAVLHPDNLLTGDINQFHELQEAYRDAIHFAQS